MKTLKRTLIALFALFALVLIFYAEEDVRGWHAWQKCKRELAAKGEVLDWNAYIPPPVPDDQNFFKAPNMTEWFVKGAKGGSTFTDRLQNTNTTATITTETSARDYLAWSGQFQPQFDQIREALKRPNARMDGDYSVPYEVPIPNFISVRALAQILAQRAKCHFLLGQPEKALDNLTFLNDSRRLLEGAPTGKPMTLVAAMINVAVAGLYVNTIGDGFQKHDWEESQLAALQKQLEQINLTPFVVQAFQSEPAASTHTLETIRSAKLREWFSTGKKSALIPRIKFALIPRGWIYQNMVTDAKLVYQQSEGFDTANDLFRPKSFGNLNRELRSIPKPYKFIAAVTAPNSTKAWQTTAHNQTMLNEAQIACALERYRLANGVYPSSLDVLVPQFMEKVPHDIIGGGPLHYERTTDGKFLLYSVGWNETDDGGLDAGNDYARGDWVWKN